MDWSLYTQQYSKGKGQSGSEQKVRRGAPGMARTGRVATKAAAWQGRMTVWSSGLCMPLTSLASILLQEMPAEVRNPVSACEQHPTACDCMAPISSLVQSSDVHIQGIHGKPGTFHAALYVVVMRLTFTINLASIMTG